jgi:succinate dehydrogenase/fumarate reductase flavoprotein subunit
MDGRQFTGPVWPAAAEPGDIVSEESCDIVIIGAGIAGCTAAQAASENGASVICCEKFGTFSAHGIDIGSVGTRVQKAAGVEIDKALAARLIYEWGQQQANYHLIRTYVEKSGEVLDRYIDMAERDYGMTVTLNDDMTARADWNTLEDKYKQFQTAHLFHRTEGSPIRPSKWNAAFFVEMVCDSAKKNGALFRFNTTAQQLVKSGNTVTGVLVRDKDGLKKINARKGVILATGGISDNREMIRAWCPAALRADKFENFPVGSNMGDGLVMGVMAGAAVSRCYPAPIIHPVNFSVLSPGMNTSWLTVNRDGRRFSSEMAYEPAVTNARLNAPGNVAWAIWDDDYREHIKKQEPRKAQKLLENIDEGMARALESGEYIRCDSLEALATQIGVPADNLKATVDRYNGWCAKGEDGDFGVPPRFLSPVKKAPFYACKISAYLLSLPHGLHVDQNSQVLTEDDEPIGNLFAVGNVQGDFFANSYPVTLPGTSHGRSITFGYLVGRALALGKTISEECSWDTWNTSAS